MWSANTSPKWVCPHLCLPTWASSGFWLSFRWDLTGWVTPDPCLSIWGQSEIRMDLKWGPFSQPAWASHVGPMFLNQYGAHTIFPVYAHTRLAHLHPLWGSYSKPIWPSHVGAYYWNHVGPAKFAQFKPMPNLYPHSQHLIYVGSSWTRWRGPSCCLRNSWLQ